jgi:hypothetical protein
MITRIIALITFTGKEIALHKVSPGSLINENSGWSVQYTKPANRAVMITPLAANPPTFEVNLISKISSFVTGLILSENGARPNIFATE